MLSSLSRNDNFDRNENIRKICKPTLDKGCNHLNPYFLKVLLSIPFNKLPCYLLRSELFSALIADPNGSQPGAATAIVSLDSQTGSVHANLLMSGIFETDGEKNVPLEVKFSCEHEGETRDIVEHLSIAKVDDVSINYFVLLKLKMPAAI
jgi:hypothetical protein